MEKKPNGELQTQQISLTGRVEREETKKPDGTLQQTVYDLGHRERQAELLHKDGSKELTNVPYGRSGEVRARETIKLDARGTPVAKTVVVKNNLVINNTTIVNRNTTVVREYHLEYRPSRFGYVYAPAAFVVAPPKRH